MKVTIEIEDELYRILEARAAQSDCTIQTLLNFILRSYWQMNKEQLCFDEDSIPASGKGGLLPGVDLNDNSALLDRMENRENLEVTALFHHDSD